MLEVITRTKHQRGDTLIEVMISIAIVALAIAISYAICGKNLNVGITARERTSAVGLVQGQIERMKATQQINPSALAGLKDRTIHFCFDVNNINNTTPVTNLPGIDPVNNNLAGATGDEVKYVPACTSPGGRYYIDINYVPLAGTGATANGNSFVFTARWYRAGGGTDQVVTIYYRPW